MFTNVLLGGSLYATSVSIISFFITHLILFLFILKKYLFIYVVAPGLSCSMQDLHCGCEIFSCSMQTQLLHFRSSYLTRIEPRPFALEAWNLSHKTTSEVPHYLF